MDEQPKKAMDVSTATAKPDGGMVIPVTIKPSSAAVAADVTTAPPPAAPTPPPASPAVTAAPAAEETLPNVPKFGELQPKVDAHPLFSGAKEPPPKRSSLLRKTLWPVVSLLVVIVLLYLAIDSGLIKTNVNMPFHIFKQPTPASSPTISAPPTSTQSTAATVPTTTDPYAGWTTYTSKLGNFTIKYPNNWLIEGYAGTNNTTKESASQITGNESLILLSSSSEKSNSFGLWLTVSAASSATSSTNSAFTQIPYNQGTILQTLPSGVGIWEANQSLTLNGHTVTNTCTPYETVSNGTFGTKLNNGKYLDGSMSFCYGAGQTTTNNYSQQVSSPELQQAIKIISSLKQS